MMPDPAMVETVWVPGRDLKILRLTWCPSFSDRLANHCREVGADLIHCHGLWTPANHAAATVARNLGIPLVVSTHGMLAPWSLRSKRMKKRIAWIIYQGRDLHSARLFCATAAHEAKAIRELGFTQPIAIIPNGMDLPEDSDVVGGELSVVSGCGEMPRRDTQTPQLPENRQPTTRSRTLLFLGRIYPVKGLLNLVAAWQQIRPTGWRCVIAGPDEAGHQAEVQTAIRTAGLEQEFHFPGNVDGDAKWDWYRAADLFVLPSFTENFGLVVAEALAAGVPVITTHGTPWAELVSHQCGWWVELGVEPLALALREAMAMDDIQRYEMGQRGRRLVMDNYAWPKIGRDMKEVYEWLLGGGPPPAYVQL